VAAAQRQRQLPAPPNFTSHFPKSPSLPCGSPARQSPDCSVAILSLVLAPQQRNPTKQFHEGKSSGGGGSISSRAVVPSHESKIKRALDSKRIFKSAWIASVISHREILPITAFTSGSAALRCQKLCRRPGIGLTSLIGKGHRGDHTVGLHAKRIQHYNTRLVLVATIHAT
jgi:hypothetical protein